MRHLLATTLLVLPLTALAAGNIQLRLDRITTVTTPDGKTTEVRERSPRSVKPGDVLEQVATARNTNAAPIRNVRVTVPVPKNTTFTAGDLSTAVVSIDHGKTYATAPLKESVIVNGQKVERLVPASRYTHVRFLISTVPANTSITRAFRVSVN